MAMQTAPRTEPLSEHEHAVLDDLFTIAARHDRACKAADDKLRTTLGLRSKQTRIEIDVLDAEQELNDLLSLTDGLHALIARAALDRAAFLGFLHPTDSLLELDDTQAERLVRPIFEESGIGDRYVVAGQ